MMDKAQTEALLEIRCCECGLLFAMPDHLRDQRKKDGHIFYCPNGHSMHFTDTPGEKIETLTKERDFWQAEAEKRLEECDRLRSTAVSRRWWDSWREKR